MYNIFLIKGLLMPIWILLALWVLVWKMYAVWVAAQHKKKGWFVLLLVLNTASILEMIYIFKIEKKTWAEVKSSFKRNWHSLKKRF